MKETVGRDSFERIGVALVQMESGIGFGDGREQPRRDLEARRNEALGRARVPTEERIRQEAARQRSSVSDQRFGRHPCSRASIGVA